MPVWVRGSGLPARPPACRLVMHGVRQTADGQISRLLAYVEGVRVIFTITA